MFAGMDLSVILTYRCQSRCSMCQVWQHPSVPAEEIGPATLAKLPNGFRTITLTGYDGGKLGPLGQLHIHVDVPHIGRSEEAQLVVLHMISYYFMEEPLSVQPGA